MSELAGRALPEDAVALAQSSLHSQSTAECPAHQGTECRAESQCTEKEVSYPQGKRDAAPVPAERGPAPQWALCPLHLEKEQEAAGRSRNADTGGQSFQSDFSMATS